MATIALVAPDALPVLSPDQARYGGTEAVIWNLAQGLAARGHAVTLYAKTGSEAPVEVRLVSVPSVQAILREHADDLLRHPIIHDHSWSLLAWKLAERIPDRRFWMTWHGPTLGPAVQWQSPPPNLTVCGVSAWHADLLSAELDAPVLATPNGVDLDRYPLYEGPRDDYILYLARLAPEKGLHVAMRIAERIGRPLYVAGTEHLVSDPTYVQAMLRRMDGHSVRYLGDLGGEAKVHAIQRAQAVLVPAVSFPEPFGLYAVEALACGTPVVTWSTGAVADVIGSCGYAGHSVDDLVAYLRGQRTDPWVSPAACRDQATHWNMDSMIDAVQYVPIER